MATDIEGPQLTVGRGHFSGGLVQYSINKAKSENQTKTKHDDSSRSYVFLRSDIELPPIFCSLEIHPKLKRKQKFYKHPIVCEALNLHECE